MERLPESHYWVEAPTTSLTRDADSAVLVLRLALAVNALRSQQRYSLHIGDDPPTAAAKRDRVLSFVIAAAFTDEAIKVLTGTGGVPPESRRVRALAERAEAPLELYATVQRLMAGTHQASALLTRVRNQLTFHWDPGVVRDAMRGFEDDDPLVWEEGERPTRGETFYRLAGDVLANALVLNRGPAQDRPAGDADGAVALAAATTAIVEAMTALSDYFEYAIAGYLEPFAVIRRVGDGEAK